MLESGVAFSGCTLNPTMQGFRIVLLALGLIATTVAGGAGVWLALRAARARHDGVQRPGLLMALIQTAQRLALLTLGAGLVLSAAEAWLAFGSLRSGDPRLDWLAVSWLVEAAGLLAWRLRKHAIRWAAALAVLATGCVLLGLLAVPALVRRLGI
jgi:hypothetical protein